ncbi:MAG: translation initiation factor IF-2, partial [Acidimicrobiales bacterium]|nr:translation initiation factor IF-2 [Acidimicrobiales bacterium]
PIPPPPGHPRTSESIGAPYRSGPPGGFRRPAGGGDRPHGGGPGGGRAHAGAPPPPGGRPGGPPGGARPGGPRGAPRGGPRGRPRRRRRRQREELQPQQLPAYTPVDAPVPEGEIVIERGSTAQEVAARLNRSAADIVRFLLQQGEMVTATQSLSDDMIELFAAELGADVRITEPGAEQEEELLRALEVDLAEDGAQIRPPVVTVMGHVDHGKTLLLDRIRSSNVVEGEAGGITQHIGAYQTTRSDHRITFIDTPGHEAFTAMRARGAQATDVVVLVVAADDGVMPQTAEAIDHAQAADVPIIVAINKMDRPGADADRVRAQLAERGLVPESYGGEVITVPMSAMTGEGIDELLDQILLVAELEELTAPASGRAVGIVLEAHLDRGRGPVATVLVERGTLRIGEPMVAGAAWGRVRAMTDDRGAPLSEAGPSMPVEVLGLGEVARSGDLFVVAPDEKTAGKVAETREHWQRQASLAGTAGGSGGGARLEDIFKQVQAGETATLNLVLKADVHGSLEAVTDSLRKLEREDVKLSFVSRGVGGINENDVQLAAASEATIIGFNVRPDRNARQTAETEDVEVRLYEIIYDLISDVQNAMVGLLEPEFEEIVAGEAQVRQVFRISGVGPVAGCVVEHGNVRSGAKVRFLRDGTIIWKGSISSLRHFQDDVAEVSAGMECGIGLSDFSDLKEGDVIETYTEREIARVA